MICRLQTQRSTTTRCFSTHAPPGGIKQCTSLPSFIIEVPNQLCSSYYGVADNSEPHAGGYRKFLPQVASASELTTSQRATVTPQIAASTPTPAIAYAASQTELPAPAASNSLLGSALLDQQYNRGDNFNPYGWVGSSDSLGWECESGYKRYLTFF